MQEKDRQSKARASGCSAITFALVLVSVLWLSSAANAGWLIDEARRHVSAHGRMECLECHGDVAQAGQHPRADRVDRGPGRTVRTRALHRLPRLGRRRASQNGRCTEGGPRTRPRTTAIASPATTPTQQMRAADAGQVRPCAAAAGAVRQLPRAAQPPARALPRRRHLPDLPQPLRSQHPGRGARRAHPLPGLPRPRGRQPAGRRPGRVPMVELGRTVKPHQDVACLTCHPRSAQYGHSRQATADCRQCHVRHPGVDHPRRPPAGRLRGLPPLRGCAREGPAHRGGPLGAPVRSPQPRARHGAHGRRSGLPPLPPQPEPGRSRGRRTAAQGHPAHALPRRHAFRRGCHNAVRAGRVRDRPGRQPRVLVFRPPPCRPWSGHGASRPAARRLCPARLDSSTGCCNGRFSARRPAAGSAHAPAFVRPVRPALPLGHRRLGRFPLGPAQRLGPGSCWTRTGWANGIFFDLTGLVVVGGRRGRRPARPVAGRRGAAARACRGTTRSFLRPCSAPSCWPGSCWKGPGSR